MKKSRTLLAVIAVGAGTAMVPASAVAQEPHRPYAGLEGREIKALSPERTEALRNGEGAGFALAAELNGYPGPKHVLELETQLELTDDQRSLVTGIFEEMHAAAVALGDRLVAAERALDRGFADGDLDDARLLELTREIGIIESELRATHLVAHLSTTEVLTTHQRRQYLQLRGYEGHEGRDAGHLPED